MAWHPAPALVRLRLEINELWPWRDRASDGMVGDVSHQARKSDHNPDYTAGGIVRAIDVDEDGIPARSVIAQIITDPRTAYVIYEGRIWENPAAFPGRGYWRTYTGPSPHAHHFHVSVRRGRAWDSSPAPWGLVAATSAGGVSLPTLPTVRPVAPIDDLTPLSEEDDDMLIVDAGAAGSYLLSGGRLLGLDAEARAALVAADVRAVSITRDRYLQWIAGTGSGVMIASPQGAYQVSSPIGAPFEWVPDMARVDELRGRGIPVVSVSQAAYDALVSNA